MSVRTARFAAALLGCTLAGVLAAPMAGAQTAPGGSTTTTVRGPYGSTTTTAPAGVEEATASCGLTLSPAKPGDAVTATVKGVFFDEHVRILFDGVQVGETTAPSDPADIVAHSASAPVAFGGQALAPAADDGTTTVTVKFTIPKAAPGKHIVTAVGDTFTCFCNPRGEFTVLAASGSGGGSLAKTGVEAGLLLAIAVGLLTVGRAFVTASRRRRPDALADDAQRNLTSVGR